MVKQDFIDGLRLYVSYKMNIDPWLWVSNGPHGSRFKKNVYLILLSQYFPAMAARLVIGKKGHYGSIELEKAKYNVVIFNELNRLIMEFCEAFRDAEVGNDLFSEGAAVNTKVPIHLIKHFQVGDLGKLIIPRYSVYYDHPWVRSYMENPLGYLKGEWSHPTELPNSVLSSRLPSGGVAQYIDRDTATVVSGTITPTRRVYPDGREEILSGASDVIPEQTSSIPGAW